MIEPTHDKTNKMTCTPSVDSDQPGHPPSLIRVFAVRIKKRWVLSFLLRRLWLDWADDQADLSIRWAHVIFLVLSCGGSYSANNAITDIGDVISLSQEYPIANKHQKYLVY